jgi:hypothetical protein
MLEKSPLMRYLDYQSLLADLRKAAGRLGGKATTGMPVLPGRIDRDQIEQLTDLMKTLTVPVTVPPKRNQTPLMIAGVAGLIVVILGVAFFALNKNAPASVSAPSQEVAAAPPAASVGAQPANTPVPPPDVPLSQGKTISASSQFSEPGFNPERANDGDVKTRWASDYSARSGWLQIDLGEEKEIGRVWISEVEWPATREFAIEALVGDKWTEVAHGTTIGQNKELTIAPVKARQVRLNILRAETAININEFQVFGPTQN